MPLSEFLFFIGARGEPGNKAKYMQLIVMDHLVSVFSAEMVQRTSCPQL